MTSKMNDRFEDVSSYSSSKEYKSRRKNRRGRTVIKSILGVFCALLIVFGTGLIYISADLLSELSTVTITKDKEKLGISPTATTDDSITNIAFFGVDQRDGSFSGLSDAIMIVTIDNKHNKVKLTSILRDSKVYINNYGYSKINAAYSLGGAELAINTINSNFNLNITDYVTVNFYKLAAIVDAFNGTEITLTDEEAYQTNQNLNSLMYEQIHDGLERTIWESDFLPEVDGYVYGGDLTLTGNQAVAYARDRTDSDAHRANRQKKVLMGLFARLKKMGTAEYYPLLQKIFPMCETSLDLQDVWGFAPILMNDFDIETLNIPGSLEAPVEGDQGDGLGWVWDYNLEIAAQHVDRFIYEEGSQYWDPALGNGADDINADVDTGGTAYQGNNSQYSAYSDNTYTDNTNDYYDSSGDAGDWSGGRDNDSGDDGYEGDTGDNTDGSGYGGDYGSGTDGDGDEY